MAADPRALSPRPLGRSSEPVPPVIWTFTDASAAAPREVSAAAASAGADWAIVPATLNSEAVAAHRALAASFQLIIGIDPAALMHRASRPLEDRLALLGRDRCAGVMLQDVSRDQLKAGRPFHRLYKLRDAGKLRLIFLDADTVADAEWLIDNTPAHAIGIPFGIADQTAAYRVLAAAAEMGTAILSRTPETALWTPNPPATLEDDVAFRAATPGVCSIIEPLPTTAEALDARIKLIAHSTAAPARPDWWEGYQSAVPAPPKPRRGHPADEA